MFIKPQQLTRWHAYNWLSQICFDAVVLYLWGWKPLAYFVGCIFLAGGLHPCAGHFISEHYVFPHLDEKQETYSYYGPLNYVTYNVGYHNEHHDFPFVPWSRLPLVTEITSEYYDPLPKCESWCGVIWGYVTNPKLGAYSRVKRRKEVDASENVNPADAAGDPTATTYSLKTKAS